MDNALRAAFRATHYRFDASDGELLLTVDAPSTDLAALLRSHGAASMAALTAFNPQGKVQLPSVNDRAQDLLRRDLAAGGFNFLPGRNEDPTGKWPVEESLLVLGISLADARALAARHDQVAFIWAEAVSATPRLIETAAIA